MPVHWFYNPDDIVSQFGQITKYEAPKEKQHNHSFMNAAGTYPHDKDGKQVFVIGDVINHGKREFWGVEKMHYHQGFQPGENTLNTLCTRYVRDRSLYTGFVVQSLYTRLFAQFV